MPIGKGYFWEGLSQGMRGLYGSMQNERMAGEAQTARAQEGVMDRAQKGSQFNRMFPKNEGDMLNRTLSEMNQAVSDADTAAFKAEQMVDKLKYSMDEGAKAQAAEAAAALRARADSLKASRDSVANKAATRVGGVGIKAPAKADAADADFMKKLFGD